MLAFSNSFYDRWLVFPTKPPLPEEQRDTYLLDKLEAEAPGIFNFILAGLLELDAADRARKAFAVEPGSSMDLAMKAWRAGQDTVTGWIAERCEPLEPARWTALKHAYFDYVQYCEDSGRQPLGKQRFHHRVCEAGVSGVFLKSLWEIAASIAAPGSLGRVLRLKPPNPRGDGKGPPGYVLHDIHDHTSLLRLIEYKWNLAPLTARDAAANNPLDALDLTAPPAFLEPPALPAPALGLAKPPRYDF